MQVFFDVSHMGIVDVKGTDAREFLRYVLANDVNKTTAGQALYTCMLNEAGGVIDDLIVYHIAPNDYRLVINAGCREKDLSWLNAQKNKFNVTLKERADLAMLAIQGPKVIEKMGPLFNKIGFDLAQKVISLKSFHFLEINGVFVARTGYTGEDGFEVIIAHPYAPLIWQQLIAAEIKPCGLGARDTLRLEAGLNLYGQDMDETVTPYESNLGWTVALSPSERQFIGRYALTQQQARGVSRQLVGLVLEEGGIMRAHQVVRDGNNAEGEITSGGFSPTLSKSIALARLPKEVKEPCAVMIRNKLVPVTMVKPPFVRKGQKMF